MPRFFFHVDDGHLSPDTEGTEHRDVDAARVEAVRLTGEMLREAGKRFWSGGTLWRLHVTDEAGQLVLTLHVSADQPSGKLLFRPLPVAAASLLS
jgi:hypothetical protein